MADDDVRIVFDMPALTQLLESPDGPVAKDLVRRGLRVQAAVVRMLKMTGAGRIYEKYKPRRTHQASAPGAPPATDLGSYAASIVQQLERDSDGLVEKIGTNDERGPWLELGTSEMDARPHLRPGLEAARD